MMRLLSAVGFFALAVGCMPQAAVAPGKPPRDNVVAATTALVKAGYACEAMKGKNVYLCEQEDPKIKFLIGFEEMPPRLVVAMTFTYETECDDQRLKRINLFHDHVDYAIAYCEEKALVFVGSYIIPEHGLTAKDLTAYIRWWTRSTLQAGASAGLFEDEGAPKGEEGKSGNDGTKT